MMILGRQRRWWFGIRVVSVCLSCTPTDTASPYLRAVRYQGGGVPSARRLPSSLGSRPMSRLLQPVGPESVQTYWVRRALVFGAAIVLAIAGALIIHGTSRGSAAQPSPPPVYSVHSPTTSMAPAKLQSERKARSLDEVYVPESGSGTYQAAKKSVKSTSSAGSLRRYDVRVEDGLSIDADEAALLIQGVLDDPRSWRVTRRWRFDLTPVGGRPRYTPIS